MTTVLLLSDLHVRKGPTLPETERVHAWILADLAGRIDAGLELTAIVIAGDLHDVISTAQDRMALAQFVVGLAAHAPVVIIPGNHDREGELDLLPLLHGQHPVTVYSRPAVHRIGRAVLQLLPWLDRILPIEDLRTYSAAEARAAEQARILEILDTLRADADAITRPGDVRLLAAHCMVPDAVPGLGQPDARGNEFVVTLPQLARAQAHAVLLGHVHTRQGWTVPGPAGPAPVLYNGATRRTAFGEVEAKGYTLVNVDEDGHATPTFIEVPARAMILIEDAWMPSEAEGAPWGWARWSSAPSEALEADVRFRYTVPAKQAAPARAAAEQVRQELLRAGAHKAKVDPVVKSVSRARRPVVGPTTLDQKFTAYLTHEAIDPDAPPALRARVHLLELEASAGKPLRIVGGGMRLRRIGAAGLRAFPGSVELDLDALPGPICAVTGLNGAGKSTLFNCWPGALHGRVGAPPGNTRLDRLAAVDANGKIVEDAAVSIEVDVDGVTHRIERHLGRGTAFVMGPAGGKPLAQGIAKVDAWCGEHIVSEAVHHAGPFAAQQSLGVVGMAPAARQDRLVKALGLEPLQALGKLATVRCKTAVVAREKAERILGSAGVTVWAYALAAELESAATACQARLVTLDEELAAARATLAREAEAEAAERRRWELGEQRDAFERARAGLAARAAGREGLLERGPLIRAAVVQASGLRLDLAAADALARDLTIESSHIFTRASRAGLEHRYASARAEKAAAALVDLAAWEGTRVWAEQQAARLPACLLAAEDAARAVAAAEAAIVDARRGHLELRVRGLRAGLVGVGEADSLELAQVIAAGSLGDDETIEGAPAEIGALEEALVLARTLLFAARKTLADVEHNVAKLPGVQREREAVARQIEDEATARAEAAGYDAAVRWLALERAVLDVQKDAAERARDAVKQRLAAEEDVAREADALTRAETEADTLARPLAEAIERIAELDAQIEALPPLPPETAPSTGCPHAEYTSCWADGARRCGRGCRCACHPAGRAAELESEARAAAGDLRAAQDRVRARGAAETLLATRETEALEPRLEAEAWELVVEALGPRGIQRTEVEAACPELGEIVGDLLACFGTRYAMRVTASRPTKDGEKAEITFPVVDLEQGGEERDASEWSGGQTVPFALSVNLALAMLVATRAGVEKPTLVLDESNAAIDVERAESFVGMLRKAAAAIGAGKLFLVTHDPRLAELCDAVVHVEDGRVEVRPAR